jgi:hypothetical protein
VRGIEAQYDCQDPDFDLTSGTLTLADGTRQATVDVLIRPDDLAEIDERIEVVLTSVSGGTLIGPNSIEVFIQDDDRDGEVIEATEFGAQPNSGVDQTTAVQAGLDAAAAAGRGVLLLPPGDYEVTQLNMTPGTTLSGRGARLLRPVNSEVGTHTLSIRHFGPDNSALALIEGLRINGRRDDQGPFQEYERQDDHMMVIEGDHEEPGRALVAIQGVEASESTADAVVVGPDADVALCHIRAENIWRDAVAMHGGRSRLRLRHLEASASVGTSGIWLDGMIPGFQGDRSVFAEIEDARLNTGDVEVHVVDGSVVNFRRLSMTEPPFRIMAHDSIVEVTDSVIQVGVPNLDFESFHNNFTLAHDVRLVDSTIVSSERVGDIGERFDEDSESPEMDRQYGALTLLWTHPDVDLDNPPPGTHQLSVENCKLLLDDNIEAGDTIYGVDNPAAGGAVVIRGSVLGPGFAGWFAPNCLDCQLIE